MASQTQTGVLIRAAVIAGWVIGTAVGGHTAAAQTPAASQAPNLAEQEASLRAVVRAHPNDASAHIKLGRVYVDEGKYVAAEGEARAARQSGTQQDEADGLLAWSLFLQGNSNALLSEIKPGQREPHAESEVRLSLALANMDLLDLNSAEALLRDAVRLDPSAWRAHAALARLLVLQRRLPEAREQLAEAQRIAPGQVLITRITGELDRAEGDTDGAIAEFSKVIASHPTSIPALEGRADALIAENKLSEAQQDLSTARKMGNNNSQTIFLTALILARQGKMAEADQLLTRASRGFDHMRIGYYLYGVVKFWLGQTETAEFYLAKFQAQQPNVSGVVRLRAEIALARKDPSAAISLLKPLVAANPADQDAVTLLARALAASGQSDKVLQLYEQMSAASPARAIMPVDIGHLMTFYGDAYGDLAEIEKVIVKQAPDTVVPMMALRQGDIAKASAMAEALAKSAPSNPEVQNLLGSVRLAQRRLPEAEAIFREILDKRPDFMPAAFNLVEVLVAKKQSDDARTMLQTLIKRGT